MEIKERGSHYVLTPNIQSITENDVRTINNTVTKLKKPVVIDMSGIDNCVNSFYYMLKKLGNLTLINTESGLLTTLFITGFDKYVKIFTEEISYEDNSRALINRNFSIVNKV